MPGPALSGVYTPSFYLTPEPLEGNILNVTSIIEQPVEVILTDPDGNEVPLTDGYEHVGASATDQVMGGAGAVGDILTAIIFTPTALSAGDCYIKDGSNSAMQVFKTGTLVDLKPWRLEFNITSTNGAWKMTTGATIQMIVIGQFT